MNNTTSSCPSFRCSFENTRPLAILFFIVIGVIVIDLVRDCLLSRLSDSPASVLRQDHGRASVQVQVVIPNSDDCCAVCLGEYTDGGAAVIRQLPECGHLFHRSCIDLWLRIYSTCPLCRHSTVAIAQPPPVADQ